MAISRTALDVEWKRLELIAQNLAHANSIATDGTPYRARHLVTGPRGEFASRLDRLEGVEIMGVESSNAAPRLVHEPGNPHANSAGYVAYPSIDHAAEMTLMLRTSRTYEANVVALNLARQMSGKALELGRRS